MTEQAGGVMLSADPGGLTHGLQLLRVSCKAQRGVTNHMQGNPAVAECGSWAEAYGAAALGSGQWALALVGSLNVILTCQAEQRQYAHNVHCKITTGPAGLYATGQMLSGQQMYGVVLGGRSTASQEPCRLQHVEPFACPGPPK